MVATDEMLSECLLASQSPRRQNCGADILSARRPRDTSSSSNTSLENFNHRKASFTGVASLCRGGENRFFTPGSQFSSSDLPGYYLQDANWDTTAVVGFKSTTGTWGVTQRYVYSPYGSITILNADWSTPPSGTQPIVTNLYQGMTLDAVTGLYDERFRNYSPSLGMWISQDPAGYLGGANAYSFDGGDPIDRSDVSGMVPSAGDLAQVIWAETGLLFPLFNKKGPQNGTNYNAASQASLDAAREDIAIVTTVNPVHAKAAAKKNPPSAKGNAYVYNQWLATEASAVSAHAWLMKTKCRPDLHFFIWPSANGRTPSPGHQGNPWVYQYPIIQVLGPFRKPSRGGDVPIGNNIYIFIYSSPAGK